ncbi:MAG: VOC family protein [Patescibacteria group bacterium]|jgi:predicted metalloenzyme YecM
MQYSASSFFDLAIPSVEAFNAWAEKYAPDATADHICYKCADSTEFEAIRKMFEFESAFIYQSIVSKRRIALIKFLVPIKTALGSIDLLELSDQKPDNSQTSGFDHIEMNLRAAS